MGKHNLRVHVGKTDQDCAMEGLRRAQVIGRRTRWKAGQIVCHPSDSITYDFLRAEGNIAVVGLSAKENPSGESVTKRFPLKELFGLKVLLCETRQVATMNSAAKFHQP